MKPYKTLLLPTSLYPRPEQAPEGWEVWNAPRPLCGSPAPLDETRRPLETASWKGEFLHGCFYVAIDPKDKYADTWRKQNTRNDGWVLEYISIEVAREMVFKHYMAKWGASEKWPESRIREMVDTASDKDLTQSLWNLMEMEQQEQEASGNG